MIQPEWAVLLHSRVPGIEVQFRRYNLPKPTDFMVHEDRPILSMMFVPPVIRRIGRYENLGSPYHDLGNIVFTPASVDCRFQGDGGQPLVLSCMFDQALFDRVTRSDGGWSTHQLLRTLNVGGRAGGALDLLLRRLAHELQSPGFATDTMVEGVCLTALAELSRLLGGPSPTDTAPRGKLSVAQLRRLESYIEEIPGRAPSISDMARQCGIGPRRFTTLFRETTGRTVRHWVEERRMDKARHLLAETALPMKVIAFDLGFASQGVFSMAFRRHTGITPSAYRENCGRHGLS